MSEEMRRYSIRYCMLEATLTYNKPKNSNQIFPEMKLRGIVPNFHIHVSLSDLHIPTIGPQTHYNKIGRPIVGIYKSLTDTLMWKLRTRPSSFISGNICFECYSVISQLIKNLAGWIFTDNMSRICMPVHCLIKQNFKTALRLDIFITKQGHSSVNTWYTGMLWTGHFSVVNLVVKDDFYEQQELEKVLSSWYKCYTAQS